MAWYPGKLAWQMSVSRAQLRKVPIFGRLHDFIKRECDIGSLTRQEAVSMVPPLFLDVRPSHIVRGQGLKWRGRDGGGGAWNV